MYVPLLCVRISGQRLRILVHEPADVSLAVAVEEERAHREVAVRRLDHLEGFRAAEPLLLGVRFLQEHLDVRGPVGHVSDPVHDEDDPFNVRVETDRDRWVSLQQIGEVAGRDRGAEFPLSLRAVGGVSEVQDR